jgi:hypothetical protein
MNYLFINVAFTMACPNFKKGLKIAFGPLRVKKEVVHFIVINILT